MLFILFIIYQAFSMYVQEQYDYIELSIHYLPSSLMLQTFLIG